MCEKVPPATRPSSRLDSRFVPCSRFATHSPCELALSDPLSTRGCLLAILSPGILLLLAGPLTTTLLLLAGLLAWRLTLLTGTLVLTAHSGFSLCEGRGELTRDQSKRCISTPVPGGSFRGADVSLAWQKEHRYQRRREKPAFAAPHSVAARCFLLLVIAPTRPAMLPRRALPRCEQTIGGAWITLLSSLSTVSFSVRSTA
jgi:hypothetical protein